MSFTGERPDGPPVKCGAPLSDITAGILAAMGILAAYAHRLKTGEGQWVETSLFEAATGSDLLAGRHRDGHRRGAEGDGLGPSAQCALQAFETSDKWIVVAAPIKNIGGERSKYSVQPNWRKIRGLRPAPTEWAIEGTGSPAHGALQDQTRRVLAGCARGGRRPLRARQRHAAGPRRPANHRARDGGRGRAFHARSVKTIGLPIKFSQTPGKVRSGAPLYGRTHQFNPRRLRI